MRKLIFSLTAFSALFLAACSNKDKNTSNNASTNIQGTWIMTGQGIKYYDANNNVLLSQNNPYNIVGKDTIKFTATTMIEYYDGELPDTRSYTLNTNVNPMVITVTGSNGSVAGTAQVLSLSNTQMIRQITTKPDDYYDYNTNQYVNVDHSIEIDTLIKIK